MPQGSDARIQLFFDVAVDVELLEVGPQVVDLLFVLDPGEGFFGAWDFGPGILDVFLEGCLIPDDARNFDGRSPLGQQRPNKAIDFESAMTSTPDISLHRTKCREGKSGNYGFARSRKTTSALKPFAR
jgi:hypothetical protein